MTERAAFADQLPAAVLDLVARYHHDGGRPHRLVVVSHPKPASADESVPPRPSALAADPKEST